MGHRDVIDSRSDYIDIGLHALGGVAVGIVAAVGTHYIGWPVGAVLCVLNAAGWFIRERIQHKDRPMGSGSHIEWILPAVTCVIVFGAGLAII